MNLIANQINYGLIKEVNFTVKLCRIHNEGKLVIAEKSIKTLKAKIYRKMTANDSKSYLIYLNK